MGLGIDPDDPVIDPNKWYCVFVACYQDMTPKSGCDQEFVGDSHCCMDGAFIQAWLKNGLQCVAGAELCVFTGYSAQRIADIYGPFDTYEECSMACVG